MKIRMHACRLAALLCATSLSMPAPAAPGDEAIAVIVASDHGRNLRREELALAYKRKKLFWADGSKLQPVNLPVANPLRRAFSQAVIGASPQDLEQYWNDMYFHGVSPPYVLGSEAAVLRFVIETPDAIGYVSFCNVAGRAKVLFVITPSGRITDDTGGFQCVH